jgi:hypothetical protein
MLGRKLALVAAAVAVACAAVAVPAYASWVFTGANVQGYYGTAVDLTPQVTTQTVPGDKYDVQMLNKGVWETYGEGLAVEETDTVGVQTVPIDENLAYPAYFRIVFKPKSSGGTTESISPTTTIEALRFEEVRVSLVGTSSMKAGRTASIGARVVPLCGPGKAQYVVKNVRTGRTVKSGTANVSDLGATLLKLKLNSRGTYRVQMRWMGNRFGVTSSWTARLLTVR